MKYTWNPLIINGIIMPLSSSLIFSHTDIISDKLSIFVTPAAYISLKTLAQVIFPRNQDKCLILLTVDAYNVHDVHTHHIWIIN